MAMPALPPSDEGIDLLHSLVNAAVSKEEIRTLMRADINIMGKVLLPEECTADFSPVHQILWQKLTSSVSTTLNEYLRFAIGLPRGHAKTQLLKFLCIFIIAETKRRYILVVCNTATKAKNFINDVISILSSPNAAAIYGDWTEELMRDNDEYKKFRFNGRTIIMQPAGIGSSVRGANIDNRRPDVIICDDMQDLESSQSPEIAKKQLAWFVGTLLKARNYSRCAVIYLGNMYPDVEIGERGSGVFGCILRNLDLDPDWTSIVTGAVLADGTALWEEVIPLEILMADLAQDTRLGQPHIWYAEVQNSPMGAGSEYFNMNLVPAIPYTVGASFPIGRFIMIDPSLGRKKSDAQMVILCNVYDSRGPVVEEYRIIQKSAPKLVEEVIQWALEAQVPLVCAESVAYQGTLLDWFMARCEEWGIEGISFLGIDRAGANKNASIIGGMKQVTEGSIMLRPQVLTAYAAQAAIFQPMKANNVDDLLDCVEYSWRVFTTYEYELQLPYLADWSVVGPQSVSKQEDFNAATYDFRQR